MSSQNLWQNLGRRLLCGLQGPFSLALLIAKRIAKNFIAKSANVARILSYRFTVYFLLVMVMAKVGDVGEN